MRERTQSLNTAMHDKITRSHSDGSVVRRAVDQMKDDLFYKKYHEKTDGTQTARKFHFIELPEGFSTSSLPISRNWTRRGSIVSPPRTIFKEASQSEPFDDTAKEEKHIQESRRSSLDSNEAGQPEHNGNRLDKHNDRIVINVGGMKHETFRSTLRIFSDTRLGWIAMNSNESIDAYDPIRNEYFFDRHPHAFLQIINFYRTGKLHAPADICGPLFEEELAYWGLEEKSMEPCCWSKYTEHRDAQENLKVFDNLDLNQNDEDMDQIARYEQQTEAANLNNNFVRRIFQSVKPLYFRSNKWLQFKRKTWRVFEDHSVNATFLSKAVSIVSLTFIMLSVFSLCFHSMMFPYPQTINDTNLDTNGKCADGNTQVYADLLLALDVICVTWFTIEYCLRFISSPNRLSFLFQIMNIFDVVTIIPYFINFKNISTCYIRTDETVEIISIARLFRLFRFFRLSTGLEILKHTMIASSKELLLLGLLLAIPVAIFATIVYYCERKVKITKFKTIPESLWWAIVTMTTVGYGDMAPQTTVGKMFGAICAAMSVLILALPVSIIGNNFTLFYHYAQARLKLPKKPKNALVGAANALVAEASHHSLSSEDDCSDDSDCVDDQSNIDYDIGDQYKTKNTLALDTEFANNVSYSKRYRRERLSLYATGPSHHLSRRSRSMGTVKESNPCKKRQSKPELTSPPTDEQTLNNGVFNMAFDNEVASLGRKESDISTASLTNSYSNETNEQEHNNNDDVIGSAAKTDVSFLPKTVITEAPRLKKDVRCEATLANGKHLRPHRSPPVQRRNGNVGEVSVCISNYDETDSEIPRKNSNNHLYVPQHTD